MVRGYGHAYAVVSFVMVGGGLDESDDDVDEWIRELIKYNREARDTQVIPSQRGPT